MPLIDLTYVRGSVEQPALDRLTDELVTALLRAERAPDTPFLRDNTLLYLHELDPAAQSVGGRAFHMWTLIHEIPEGNWAGGGRSIYRQQVEGLVADEAP